MRNAMTPAIRLAVACLAALAALNGPLQGAVVNVTVPGEFEDKKGTAMQITAVRDLGLARTYQVQIAAAVLAGVPVGSEITALRWRLADNYTSDFPALATTWDNYDITLAQAAKPMADFSKIFADNMIAPTLVRSGKLTIEANAFTTAGSPNDWGPWIEFTDPYIYQGGDLIITYRHTGHDIDEKSYGLDAVKSTIKGDYGTLYRAQLATAYDAEEAMYHDGKWDQNFTITQFRTTQIPEPASIAIWLVIAMGFFSVGFRRPRRGGV